MKQIIFLAAGFLIMLSVADVYGEVADSSCFGFTLRSEIMVDTTQDVAFLHFIRDIGSWWDPEHTYSGDAANLFIQPQPGGCFCEQLPGGGFVTHMNLIYSYPGKILRLSGALGPLQSLALNGVLTVSLEGTGKKTKMVFTYTVSGNVPGGLQKYAPLVDGVLSQQWERFRSYVGTLPIQVDPEDSLQK